MILPQSLEPLPNDQTTVVLLTGTSAWSATGVHGMADRVQLEPFDAIEIEVANLWPKV